MVHKIMAVSLKEENLNKIMPYIRKNPTKIRNKSHLVDIALEQFFERENSEVKKE